MKKITFIVASIIALAACTPKTTEVIVKTENTENKDFPSGEIAEGSSLYADNCGKCHELKNVNDYTDAQWKKIVPNMAAQAKLDATQENKIMQFVLWKSDK